MNKPNIFKIFVFLTFTIAQIHNIHPMGSGMIRGLIPIISKITGIPLGAEENNQDEYQANDNDQDECAICLDSLENGIQTITICKKKKQNSEEEIEHKFHKNCIRRWLNERPVYGCPLCKDTVSNEIIDQLNQLSLPQAILRDGLYIANDALYTANVILYLAACVKESNLFPCDMRGNIHFPVSFADACLFSSYSENNSYSPFRNSRLRIHLFETIIHRMWSRTPDELNRWRHFAFIGNLIEYSKLFINVTRQNAIPYIAEKAGFEYGARQRDQRKVRHFLRGCGIGAGLYLGLLIQRKLEELTQSIDTGLEKFLNSQLSNS